MLHNPCKIIGLRFALFLTLFSGVTMMATPGYAAGDLLVAPTRIILDGRRGTEVILNNTGDEEATYRISLELRRMTELGQLVDVSPQDANEIEDASLKMIRFAPKRVTLAPNQPQSIRIGVQVAEGMPDGEYRAHMLFRAIPKTPEVAVAENPVDGVQIQLIPIYGITIPIIIRKGQLRAVAALANPHIVRDLAGPALNFDLSRDGNRSVYGEIRVTKAGQGEPIFETKGLAIYPEINSRLVSLTIDEETAAKMKGPITIGYYETPDAGGGLIAEVQTIIN